MNIRKLILFVAALGFPEFARSQTPLEAAADVRCATAEQIVTIADAVAKLPAALPNSLSDQTGIPEAIVLTGLDPKTAIGTTGSGFAKIWDTLAAWERPAFLVPLDKHNMLEIFGRIGPHINQEGGAVAIDVEGSGIGGHFHPASIGSIYMVRIPRGGDKVAQGILFFSTEGRTLLAIYSISSPSPTIVSMLRTDVYQRTWELLASMPRVCPR